MLAYEDQQLSFKLALDIPGKTMNYADRSELLTSTRSASESLDLVEERGKQNIPCRLRGGQAGWTSSGSTTLYIDMVS